MELLVKSLLTAAAAGLSLTSLATGAHAQDAVSAPKEGAFFGRTFNIALRGWVSPTYEGGKHFGLFPGGSLAVTRPSDFDSFAAPDDAASFALFDTRHFSAGIAAAVRENRYNNDELTGMRSIGWSIQGGGYLNYWPTPWLRLHIEGLKGLTTQYGVLINTSADAITQQGRWRLSAGPRFSWGDGAWNNRYFGVTAAEALASPYIASPYTAKAGAHFVGLEGSGEYKLTRGWRLTLDARYHHLLSDDANSPLVKQLGTADQFQGSAGFRVMFPD
jgi:outer membrane scaffolding protein for murein synthesis (MipA/OmpV family)